MFFSFEPSRKFQVLLFTFVLSCGVEKGGGDRSFILIPDSKMNELGAEAYAEIKAKTPLSTNVALSEKVKFIGQRIAKASGADFVWEFSLFESKDINAFCLPGGKIGIYTGILGTASNNAGLAAIMGHEVAHAVLRHSAEKMSNGLIAEVGFAAIAIGLEDSTYRDEILAGLGLGYQVGISLPFGRDQESEADRLGLMYMAKAGYDPSEAPKLWDRMAQLGGGTPEILSTHPNPKDRANDLRSWQAEVSSTYDTAEKVATENL